MTGLAVRPRLLSEEIYSTLRNAIIEERLAPGLKIVEERLAAELGVSRIPLREALHKLERDGFVESLAHKGFRVIAFKPSEVRQTYEIREVLEVLAAEKALKGRTESGLQHLAAAFHALRESVTGGDELAVVGRHVAFHRALYEMGDNPRLVQILSPFMELGFTARVARKVTSEGTWDDFLASHARIMEAVGAGDSAGLQAEMLSHLASGHRLALAVASAD